MVLSMDRWVGKVAIVTGASVGIGAAICEQLVGAGVIVAGFARRKERVEELAKKLKGAKGKLYAVKVDVTKEEEILEGFKWVAQKLGHVHILINNAGVLKSNSLMNGDTKLWKDVIDTNVIGLCIATREACKVMTANKIAGHIIHINSITGHFVINMPLNIYPASKHAVTALSQQLRYEFNTAEVKIKITSISPGAVETEIFSASGMDPEVLQTMKGTMPFLKTEEIADAVTYALSTGPECLVQELIIRPVLEKI